MSDSSRIKRAERHDVDFSGRLEPLGEGGEGSPALDVKIVNLSIGGAGVVCQSPIKPDSRWTLHIDPELCDDLTETVVVRSCKKEDGHYRCGLQFVTAASIFLQAGLGIDSAIEGLNTIKPEQVALDSTDVKAQSQARITFDEPAIVDHLSFVHVTADNELMVKGNMAGCQTSLGGPLRVDGFIAGGRVETRNTIKVTTLGQPNQTTTLVLGSLPRTNALINRVPSQLETFDRQIEDKHAELAYINNHGSELGHTARERAMELDFDLQELQGKRGLLQKKFDQLLEHYQENTCIDLQVQQAVHPGVVIEFANQQYRFTRAIPGPLTIQSVQGTELSIELSDKPAMPLADLLAA